MTYVSVLFRDSIEFARVTICHKRDARTNRHSRSCASEPAGWIRWPNVVVGAQEELELRAMDNKMENFSRRFNAEDFRTTFESTLRMEDSRGIVCARGSARGEMERADDASLVSCRKVGCTTAVCSRSRFARSNRFESGNSVASQRISSRARFSFSFFSFRFLYREILAFRRPRSRACPLLASQRKIRLKKGARRTGLPLEIDRMRVRFAYNGLRRKPSRLVQPRVELFTEIAIVAL